MSQPSHLLEIIPFEVTLVVCYEVGPELVAFIVPYLLPLYQKTEDLEINTIIRIGKVDLSNNKTLSNIGHLHNLREHVVSRQLRPLDETKLFP